MAQEQAAQAGAVGGALDQAGDVGDHEAAVHFHADHAQVRVQGGERVVGHFRRRRRDRTDEGGLAGVGEAQQADVGQQLHFHADLALFARGTGAGLARRTVHGALVVHVALAADAALGDQQAIAVVGEVADDLVGLDVDDLGADGYADGDVLAGLAEGLAAHAVLAALGAELALVAEVDQRVEVLVRLQPHAAAIAAVAAIRPAERNELLAPEADAAVAAVAGDDQDLGFIYEFHWVLPGRRNEPNASIVGRPCRAVKGMGLTSRILK